MTKKINLVFMGGFTYPHGMAGTKRIQNAINGLKEYPHIEKRVILQRQANGQNVLSGVHDGIRYETVIGNQGTTRAIASLPFLYYKTIAVLKNALQSNHKNIIYFYGPLFLDSIVPLSYAHRLGYKIVFDVIEDYSLAGRLTRTFYHKLRDRVADKLSLQINTLSDGIIVISSHLQRKYKALGTSPIHYMPISVDMNQFSEKAFIMGKILSLLYSGSFGQKDGLPVLLDAFDKLAGKYVNIRIVLTGQGNRENMRAFFGRVESSPHKDRIIFKGYLEEKDYYSLLNEVDIPCMTRMGYLYAQAGFPFKLGEYLATGKPVIASRVSDVDRYLTHGHNAMLVKAGSSNEICEAVEFLINNPESAAAIGVRGREVAQSFFDYKKQGKALFTFLENV